MQNVWVGNSPACPRSISPVIGPPGLCHVEVIRIEALDPFSITIPTADSRMSSSISSTSSSLSEGTWGPRTEVALAARRSISLPLR
jgi:hypothetical protein